MTTKKQSPKESRPARSRKKAAEAPAVQEPHPTLQTALEPSVAELAHRLFLERGGAHGHDVDDWLEAERRLRNGH